jgi:hypothetical protein
MQPYCRYTVRLVAKVVAAPAMLTSARARLGTDDKKGPGMAGITKTVVLAAALAGTGLVGAAPAAVAADHDGNWSVLVVTESGTCDRGYRYNVRVAGGRLTYQGNASVDVAGTVAANGAVRVSIRLGQRGADGTGRLGGSSGSGTWRGQSSAGPCAGRWEAEKR